MAESTTIAVTDEARRALWAVQGRLATLLGKRTVTVSETIAWLCERELARETT